jgi:uroporphyrinogen-III synthase
MKKTYLFSLSQHPKTININSLEMSYFKPTKNLDDYDYLIVTSKQISDILEHFKITPIKPALCISIKTAQAYENIGGEVLTIGKGYGDTLVETIQSYPKETKWLYLRAKEVASNFAQECRDNGYCIEEEIVYESFCSQEILSTKVEEDATLIFTSPSSVKCFLKNNCFSKQHQVIVIGKTTAKMIPLQISCKISEKTTINSCIELLN